MILFIGKQVSDNTRLWLIDQNSLLFMESFVRNNNQSCPGNENLTVLRTKIPSLMLLNRPTFFRNTLNEGQYFASQYDRIFS